MDSFIRHIQDNFFVDYSEEEVLNISVTINLYLGILKDLINKKWREEGFQFQIEYIKRCGSMEETTRVWEVDKNTYANPEPVLEYDYLAIIKPTGFILFSKSSHPGYMKLYLATNDSWWSYIWAGSFPAETFFKKFYQTTLSIMKDSCQKFDTNFYTNTYGFLGRKNRDIYDCSCFECMCSYYNLHLLKITQKDFTFSWTSVQNRRVTYIDSDGKFSQRMSKNVLIKLDFLPVFKMNNGSVNEYFLIPKLCPTLHENCWRISYCDNEIQKLKETTQCHRDVYKIIKSLVQILDWIEIPSYDIKNVVLNHIQHCKNGEGHTLECMCTILSEFGNYINDGKVPHFEIFGLNLERKFQTREYHAFGQFLVLLSQILARTPETASRRYLELKLQNRKPILWKDVLRPELFTTYPDIVSGKGNCQEFHEELSKVKEDFEKYYEKMKEECDVKLTWKKKA